MQRPCGSTGEWLSRTWLCAQEAIGIALLSIEIDAEGKEGRLLWQEMEALGGREGSHLLVGFPAQADLHD